ncbi:uncharacterized protein BJX67DRAFT_380576 [Aspergillus lucknowensis]|uniref:Fork-head domain-containing protein n=1 Tax=Aspergillus lucknowensis TaxID=176173 RepID=A0ABR4LUF9_9EURO
MSCFDLPPGSTVDQIPFNREPLRQSVSRTPDTYPSSALDSTCYETSPTETWSDSSSHSPETMMPYQQPWAVEPALNYSIIPPQSPIPDGLPRTLSPSLGGGGGSPEWLSLVMTSNCSPSRQLNPETRRLSVGKPSPDWVHAKSPRPLYKASLPADTLPPHSQSSSSPTNPTSTSMSYHSIPLSMARPPVKLEIDREDIPMDEVEDTNADPPYSQLIYEALLNAPGKKLPLQGIYMWFEKNTAKGRDRGSKGWQNSIRHNLSMNAGFEAVREESTPGKKAVNYWRLTDEAVQNGIQSTTRYRKQANYKKSATSDPPAPQRQRSGAKGGKATKVTARFRSNQSINSMPGVSQDEYRRERGYRQHQLLRHNHQAQRVSPSQQHHQLPPSKNPVYSQYLRRSPPTTTTTTTTTATAAVPSPVNPSRAGGRGGQGGPTTPLVVEGFDLSNIVGCVDSPPCTAPTAIFCDMAGPNPDCLVFDAGFMAWDGIHSSFAASEISTADLHVGP